MSYTTERQPQGIAFYVTNKIREAMIGEIVAINDYSKHIYESGIPDLDELLHHIMLEEKEHYGLLLEILRKYDPVEAKKFNEVKGHENLKSKCLNCYGKGKKCCELILNNLRSDIKGELEAIVLYEEILERVTPEDVKDLIRHIVSDEKEHVEELTAALMKLDKDKYGPLK